MKKVGIAAVLTSDSVDVADLAVKCEQLGFDSLWLGEHPTKEQIKMAQKELGFDKPKTIQFYRFIENLIKGDMGISLRTRQPVIEELGARFLATLELVTISMFFALFIGFPMAVVTVLKEGKAIDTLIRVFGYVGMSFPVFWLGMLLQIVFFGLLGWLPLQGRLSGDFSSVINHEASGPESETHKSSFISGSLVDSASEQPYP